MRTLYFDVRCGAAGDMIAAALLDLHPNPEAALLRLNQLGIPALTISADRITRRGSDGLHLSVFWQGQEEAESIAHAEKPLPMRTTDSTLSSLLAQIDITEKVRACANTILSALQKAETAVHGVPAEDIHFHRLGTMDALADIVSTCLLLEELQPDRILASPVNVGSGQIACRLGFLPVPAPTTTQLLSGIPYHHGPVEGELCTPTGAAILVHFVDAFCERPQLPFTHCGCGIGTRDYGLPGGLVAWLAD